MTINIIPKDDNVPVLFTDGTMFSYVENGDPASIVGPNATISDADSYQGHMLIKGITVTLLNGGTNVSCHIQAVPIRHLLTLDCLYLM